MTTVIFSHGQESGPWGTKIRAMADLARELGCVADSIDYQGIADPTERVEKLIAECSALEDNLVLVGSSMGGHVVLAVRRGEGLGGAVVGWAGARGRREHVAPRPVLLNGPQQVFAESTVVGVCPEQHGVEFVAQVIGEIGTLHQSIDELHVLIIGH